MATAKGEVRHQSIGIPMGTNCGPEVANLTLFRPEIEYISALETEFRNPTLPKELRVRAYYRLTDLSLTGRYIDDLFTVARSSGGCMPPSETEYGLGAESRNGFTYIGAFIAKYEREMVVSRYDKSASYRFKLLRYPSARSCTPTN